MITTYNLANEITNAGYTYDNAGNLLSDGTATYTYDALNRMTARGGTTYGYNGDGTLVSQLTAGVTTRYTQDLAAPLSQVLQTQVGAAARTDSLFALGRIATLQGSTRTWYVADALGSVRRTVSDAGVPLGIITYDPWGSVESGAVPTFGFTGELHASAAGLVNLRARWYSTAQGRFLTRDVWAGETTRPGSLNKYAYVEDDPINAVDPTGLKRFRIWAAAFISPKTVQFPYVYGASITWSFNLSPTSANDCVTVKIDNGVDSAAQWHGDNRVFSLGEIDHTNPRSRQWHEVIVDTDPNAKSPLVNQYTDTGYTGVDYHRNDGMLVHEVGKADPPDPAEVTRLQGGTVMVRIYGNRGNPLANPQAVTPHIVYDYLILLSDHALWVNGEHSAYPWQELLIREFDPAGTRAHFIEQYDPTDTYLNQYAYPADPGYLFFRNKKVQKSIYL